MLENKEETNYDSLELDDSVVAEENALESINKLREKLKKCETERQEYLIGWQRAKADMVNAKKRDEIEKLDFVRFANERLVEDLIPVLESFNLAINNKETWEKVDKNWRIGVEYIYSQLFKALNNAGLQEINPAGQTFDHSRDEAVEYIPVTNKDQHHKILAVIQKGYSLNGKNLRPPKVKVGEFKEQ